MTRVLVVDDQSLIRQAVSDILTGTSGIDVVGQAVNGADAVAQARSAKPDVVLMDIRMPELSGIDATAQICADPELSRTRVLILTTFEEDENVVAALRAGASGFIGKGSEPEDIVRAVQVVDAGDSLFSAAATRALISRHLQPAASPVGVARLDQLTNREREVLVSVARGNSNQEIATALFISPHTAKTHVNRIMSKLHTHDRAQLVIIAYETALVTPGS